MRQRVSFWQWTISLVTTVSFLPPSPPFQCCIGVDTSCHESRLPPIAMSLLPPFPHFNVAMSSGRVQRLHQLRRSGTGAPTQHWNGGKGVEHSWHLMLYDSWHRRALSYMLMQHWNGGTDVENSWHPALRDSQLPHKTHVLSPGRCTFLQTQYLRLGTEIDSMHHGTI